MLMGKTVDNAMVIQMDTQSANTWAPGKTQTVRFTVASRMLGAAGIWLAFGSGEVCGVIQSPSGNLLGIFVCPILAAIDNERNQLLSSFCSTFTPRLTQTASLEPPH
jgi:hypothetical protein